MIWSNEYWKDYIWTYSIVYLGKHKDKKIHDIGFSNADTIPRFGRAVSYDTFPVLINEVDIE